MNRDKLKLIIKNLELLTETLKAEVYSDTQSYLNFQERKDKTLHDYDEIFDDDDGYPD